MVGVEVASVLEASGHLVHQASAAASPSFRGPCLEPAFEPASACCLGVAVGAASDTRPFSALQSGSGVSVAVVGVVEAVAGVAVAVAVESAAVAATEHTCQLAFGPWVVPSEPFVGPSWDCPPSHLDLVMGADSMGTARKPGCSLEACSACMDSAGVCHVPR